MANIVQEEGPDNFQQGQNPDLNKRGEKNPRRGNENSPRRTKGRIDGSKEIVIQWVGVGPGKCGKLLEKAMK